jgi:hypothetical protein
MSNISQDYKEAGLPECGRFLGALIRQLYPHGFASRETNKAFPREQRGEFRRVPSHQTSGKTP